MDQPSLISGKWHRSGCSRRRRISMLPAAHAPSTVSALSLSPSFPPDHGRRNPPSPCSSQGAHRPLRPPFTASSGQLSCYLFRPLPSIILPAQSRCSSQISQTGSLPPQARSPAPRSPCSTPSDCRLRPALPLQFPTNVSRSPLATFRGPSPPNLTAPLHFLSIEPRTSRTARDPVSLSLTATFQQIADVPVCRPSQHSTAILRASRAKPDLSATRASPSSSAPRVHGSTFRLPLDLLPSTPPLASDSSQPPKSVTALAQRTHPSHSCCRSVLSLFPTPSASSPM